ncbi:MAG: glycosyltransferase family 2 protein [Clostridia bacterium]|nr:glycosyltransferase family 2 protein [Clostridia bacterium]
MNQKPLVSIVTPCYNSEEYIHRYLDSVLAQTYDNVELVLVNDGSKDGTEQAIYKYKEKIEARGYILKYIRQENKGIGGAINTGIKYITGEYFAWCDSDNFYASNYIESKINFFLKHPEYAVVRCDGYIVFENELEKPIARMSKGNTDLYNEKLFYNCIDEKNFHFGCAMIKTSDFDIVNPKREIYPSREGQNWQLLLPVFYHFKSGYIDEPMFYFVFRQDSVSNITSTQSVEKKVNQMAEYEKILKTTICSMNIPEEKEVLKRIEVKYSERRLYLYAKNKMKDKMEQEHLFLKENDVKLKRSTRVAYRVAKNGLYRFCYNVFSWLRRVLKKLRKADKI